MSVAVSTKIYRQILTHFINYKGHCSDPKEMFHLLHKCFDSFQNVHECIFEFFKTSCGRKHLWFLSQQETLCMSVICSASHVDWVMFCLLECFLRLGYFLLPCMKVMNSKMLTYVFIPSIHNESLVFLPQMSCGSFLKWTKSKKFNNIHAISFDINLPLTSFWMRIRFNVLDWIKSTKKNKRNEARVWIAKEEIIWSDEKFSCKVWKLTSALTLFLSVFPSLDKKDCIVWTSNAWTYHLIIVRLQNMNKLKCFKLDEARTVALYVMNVKFTS